MLYELEAESIAREKSCIEVCHDSVRDILFLGPGHHPGSQINNISKHRVFFTPLFRTNYASESLAGRNSYVASNTKEAGELFSDPEPCIDCPFCVVRVCNRRNAPQNNQRCSFVIHH